jgi:uncharacterized protein YfiM (DUF2279 family)
VNSLWVRRAIPAALLAATIIVAEGGPARPAWAGRVFLPLEREGPWLGSDKTLHLAGSLAIAASLRVEGRSERAAAGLTLGLGLAKELYDAAWKPAGRGRGASRKDLVMDLLGAAAGIMLLRAVDR